MMDLNDRQNAIKYFEAQRDNIQKFLKAVPEHTVAYQAYTLEIEYLNLAVEAITALDDLWQTQTFKDGWEEGFGMGKQELAHKVEYAVLIVSSVASLYLLEMMMDSIT